MGVLLTSGHALGQDALRIQKYQQICQHDPRVVLGLVQEKTCVGARLFFDETFGGNGRTCGTCHPANNNYTVDPDFIARLDRRDPIFVAETDPALRELEDPELLRRFALFKVNADGFDAAHPAVLRSVPHTLALATSTNPPPLLGDGSNFCIDLTTVPPLSRIGWSGDGAPNDGTVEDFTFGAIRQHATRSLARVSGTDFAPSTAAEDQALGEFMMTLGRQNELELESAHLSDEGAERGRVSFLEGPASLCSACHGEAGANAILGSDDSDELTFANFTFNVGTERARLARLDQLRKPFDAGFGLNAFDADGDGVKDSFGNGQFDTPPLIEAADTGPFFHTNASKSIEDAIAFYVSDEFATSPAGEASGGAFAFEPADIADLGRFLRVLNAALNVQMALARVDAAQRIQAQTGDAQVRLTSGLLELADEELEDARRVLGGVKQLNLKAQRLVLEAELALGVAKLTRGRLRSEATERGKRLLEQASASLGSGLQMQLGEGTLMF